MEDKSSYGIIAFFFAIMLSLFLFSNTVGLSKLLQLQISLPLNGYFILTSFSMALILTFFEAISSRGFDKFIVPLTSAIFLFIFFNKPDPELLNGFLIGLLIAGVIAFSSYKVRFLTANGSVATFLLAGFIFGLGGLKWSVPMMAFFVLSSILSKIRKKQNEKIEQYFEKSGVRDFMQVLANGGIGGVLVVINQIFPNEIYFIVYIAVLAAVCADTWATEIGTMVKTNTYNILNFKPVDQGVSGGISLIGTLGAFCGAFVIALSGIFWIQPDLVQYLLIVISAGLFGSFLDSILGATIQAQNMCNVCSKITERDIHCGEKAEHFKGYKLINNDMVNLFAGLSGGLIIIIVYGLL
ncbi:TIGR00297 family protein [Bacteroidota bacterium]